MHSNPTSAHVKIIVANNATFNDAFQFDPPPTDAVWTLTGQSFRMDIKGNHEQISPLISLTSGNGQIVVDDVTARIVHFNVPDYVLQGAMPPGKYFYDLIMYDASNPAIRIPLMHGEFELTDGITGG